MAKVICAKRHFGAGGELIPVGSERDGKADGVFWVSAQAETKEESKTLEVATPKTKAKAKAGE